MIGLPYRAAASRDQTGPDQERQVVLRGAIAALAADDFARAGASCRAWLARHPGDVEARLVLGLALGGLGVIAESAALLAEVAAARPDAPHPVLDLLPILERRQQSAQAPGHFAALAERAPDDARLLPPWAEWLRLRGRVAEAIAMLERAVALRPRGQVERTNLAVLLAGEGRIAEASALLREAVAVGGPALEPLGNLGVLLGHEGRFEEAFECFGAALRLNPGHAHTRVNYGFTLLKAGRLREGFAEFELRLSEPGRAMLPNALLLPMLSAEARLDGRTVLVTYDSGYGDTLQFARYLPVLAARGARVLLWVPDALGRLFQGFAGVDQVLSGDATLPHFDWQCPIIRLALVFGTELDRIPPAPRLVADPALMAAWAGRLPAGSKRIGLVWAGSARPQDPWLADVDRRRSMPLAALAPLGAVPGVRWISLQMGEAARAQPVPAGLALHDPMPEVRDFADTAAIVAQLDAVVSVDTAVAHLAASLGTPVLLMDRYDNCWRWLTGREDSPWYPGLRIFRQTRWGDWGPVVARVAAAVAALPQRRPS